MRPPWSKAMRQARSIKRRKTQAGKSRAVRYWCDLVRDAIRGTEYQAAIAGQDAGATHATASSNDKNGGQE